MKHNKKAFTIVELVIVIAIIAILAAVLIPTFASMIKKANVSKDEQLIRNLNTALATSRAERNNKPHANMTEALEAAEKFGYTVGKINASQTNNEILWDQKNDVFCYLDGNTVKYIPNSVAEADKQTKDSYLLWKIYNDNDTIPEASDQKWSIYYNKSEALTSISVSVGFDSGNSGKVSAVNYTNTGAAKTEVVIRTNNYLTNLTVNAPLDTVKHYDKAGIVNVLSIAPESYHENGLVPFLEVSGGHVVLEANSDVSKIHFTATGEGTSAQFKNENNQTISLDLSNLTEDNMPEFSRDPITIAEEGTYVAKVTTNSDEYIWLWGTGTQTEMVVSSNDSAIAVDDENGGYVLKEGLVAGTEDGSIADQIANNDLGQPKTSKEEAMGALDKGYNESLAEVLDDDGNQKYVARIGSKGYEDFEDAFDSSVNNDTIVLLDDIDINRNISKNLTFNLTIDLNSHSLVLNRFKINIKNGSEYTVKNGTFDYKSSTNPDNNTKIAFDNVIFIRSVTSGQAFQLYGKTNVQIEFNNCEIISTFATPSNNINNCCMFSFSGGTTSNLRVSVKNTTFSWNKDVPVVVFSNSTAPGTISFDNYSYNHLPSNNSIVCNASTCRIKQSMNDDLLNFTVIKSEFWVDQVTAQPAAYVVDGDTISIGSEEAFAWFAKQYDSYDAALEGKTVVLTADLDMGAYLWKPIKCNFAGTFDGNNHTISNLTSLEGYQVTSSSTRYGNGVFHRVSGTVRNLNVANATIGKSDNTGNSNISGVIAGYCSGGTFSNINVSNSLLFGFGKVGGLIGMQEGGATTISGCSVSNTLIDGDYNCAGLVGLAHGTLDISGSITSNVAFKEDIYTLTYVYHDVTEVNHIGRYWCDPENDENVYYAAWGDLYTDYQQDTIDGITYIGKCH